MSTWLTLVAGGELVESGLTDGRLRLFGYDRFVFGRSRDCDVVIRSERHARKQGIIEWSARAWNLVDLHSTNANTVDGVDLATTTELRPGAVIGLPDGVDLRVEGDGGTELRSAELEAAIVAEPHDDQRWKVYSDWLQEHDEPLGEWMATANPRGQARSARHFLGGLNWKREVCALRFRHGFVDTAAIALGAEGMGSTPDREVASLLEHPLTRFLRALEIDLESFRGHTVIHGRTVGPLEQELAPLFEVLQRGAPSTLERLSVGPVPKGRQPPDLKLLLRRLKNRCPRLQDDVLRERWLPAWLELEGGEASTTRGLVDRRFPLELPLVTLGTSLEHTLMVTGADQNGEVARLEQLAGAWVLRRWSWTAGRALLVDGQALDEHRWLDDGATFDLPTGHRFRFRQP